MVTNLNLKEEEVVKEKREKIRIFTCSENFKNGKLVKLNDECEIAGFRFVVWSFTLARKQAKSSDKIFKFLLIGNKVKYCNELYGYLIPWDYGVPHYKEHDYEAATRLIVSLMKRWEKGKWFFIFFEFIRKKLK